MPDGLLLLKRIFLEFYGVLISQFCPQKVLVKGIKAHTIFGWNNLNFAEDLFLANLQIIWLKNNEKSILLQFFSMLRYILTYFAYQKESCDYRA